VQHPGFSAVIDVDQDAYLLKAYRRHLSQSAPVRAAAIEGTGKPTAYDARGAVTQAQYHLLWPNFTININPGQPNLSLDVWLPDGPGWTHGFSEYYFGPEVTDAYARELMAFSEQVGNEDDALTSSVHRGVRAGVPVQGRFLVSSEHLVVQFQRWVVEALG
jgi:choline monooxygenase